MKTLLISFVSIIIVQLFVPAKMMYDKEVPKIYGEEFSFRTEPIDPYDPFRGKYVILNFADNNIYVNRTEKWKGGEVVFLKFEKGENDCAVISSIHKEEPFDTDFYLKTRVSYVNYGEKCNVVVKYPFTRYYMEESKAEEAEKLTRRFDRNKEQTIRATVKIYKGEATVTGLMLNDISMEDAVVRRRSNTIHH